jgi:hypothetical protein
LPEDSDITYTLNLEVVFVDDGWGTATEKVEAKKHRRAESIEGKKYFVDE